jgi:glycosyltransferase involved in cell wall biosynthesis
MPEKTSLSVIMPTYNEEQAVGMVLEQVKHYSSAFETEIIIVDSSSDQTAEIARSMGATVIKTPPRGHGDALRKGLAAAQHDFIITADCDNTYPMEYIPILLDLIKAGDHDLISCNRLTPQLKDQMPLSNKLANHGFAFLVRLLYGVKVKDVATGMFCLTQALKSKIHLETFVTVPIELIIKTHLAGFRHYELDIPYRTRIGDVTLQKWRCGKAGLKCIFNYRFNLNIDPDEL